MNNAQIITFVGLPGSGKSVAVDYITNESTPKVYVGGFIVEGIKALGQEVTEENERRFREDMRALHGKEYFMKQAVERMKQMIDAGTKTIALDGLYTWTEYKMLHEEFPGALNVISVVAPKKLRYQRLAERPIRPLTAEEAKARDWMEIENLEKGGPIAIADHFIVNDGSLDDLHHKIDDILSGIFAE